MNSLLTTVSMYFSCTFPTYNSQPMLHLEMQTFLCSNITILGQKYSRLRCLLRVKGLVICFLFGLVWQYSSVQTKYNKGRFKVMATYLQQ